MSVRCGATWVCVCVSESLCGINKAKFDLKQKNKNSRKISIALWLTLERKKNYMSGLVFHTTRNPSHLLTMFSFKIARVFF